MKKFFTLAALALTAISMNAQESALYSWQDDFEANNKITFADGATIQITGNPDKTISKGNKITIDGTEYVSMKVSNGAENTFTAPEGKQVSKATFYSYVNKDAQTDRPAYWKEVAGVTYTVDECGELMCFKDGANPDVRSYTLPEPAGIFTFTNSGEQLCYVLIVEYGGGDTPTPPASGLDIDPALPVTFDSWSASFLIKKTDVKAGDKFIFTGEAIEVADWQWGPQVLPKSNADYSDLGEALSIASGTATFTVTEDYAQAINNNGGLRVQGMACIVTDVAFEPGGGEAPVSDEKVSIIDNFNYCWNGNESVTHNEDGSITFNAVQWGGVASWLVVDGVKADWSDYSKIVFEYAEPTTVNTQILLGSYSAWGNPGITSLEMSFEDKDVSAVEQIALQCSDPTTLVITAIYLVKKGGDAVAITSLTTNAPNNAKIYNLSGQVVDKNYKGIVICNGKKYIQK